MFFIYLHHSQAELLSELQELCPGLTEVSCFCPNYTKYQSRADPQEQEDIQRTWFHQQNVLFVDWDKERAGRVHAFFGRIGYYRDPIVKITRLLADRDGYHEVRLIYDDREYLFELEPEWKGYPDPLYPWNTTGMYVAQESEEWAIYRLDGHGYRDKEVYRSRQAAEITRWLLERWYLQIFCLDHKRGISGIYQRITPEFSPEIAQGFYRGVNKQPPS